MAYSETNTYCTPGDVSNRLTSYGVTFHTDGDAFDGVQDSTEEAYLTSAIDYANALIDESLAPHDDIRLGRIPNDWLRDRAVDIACYRVMTLGGRNPTQSVTLAYQDATLRLESVKDGDTIVPGYSYRSVTLSSGRRSYGTPMVILP